MMLSDRDIWQAIHDGRIIIDPLDRADIQPASVDLHLANELRDVETGRVYPIEGVDGVSHVWPGAFWLASTIEKLYIHPSLAAVVDGKSSLARLGLSIHQTAGYFDPGFEGQGTLELSNVSSVPIPLRPGMPIAQIRFIPLLSPAANPYGPHRGSHYQNQYGATPSWMEVPR